MKELVRQFGYRVKWYFLVLLAFYLKVAGPADIWITGVAIPETGGTMFKRLCITPIIS